MASDTKIGEADAKAPLAEDSDSGGHHDALIGRVIDGCKIEKKIGQGGMGVVYLAIHESLNQEFVLKILNPALTGAEDTVDRFFREAQACAQLNHPSIVAIQNVGQDNGVYYIRMEFIEGETLEDLLKDDSQLDWREATRLCVQVADALAHAHQKGMIHRDIKPENIMKMPDGSVKVMDFGLAKHVHSSAKVSVTGQIVGTPFFMSPEQAGGKPTDARSDIYSLGVTLYYMVTGVKPFNGKNLQEIFLKHFFYAPESPKIYNDALPESLCEVVKTCLKKKKKERYQSAKALARDLQAILDNPDSDLGEARAKSEGTSSSSEDASAGDKTMVAGGGGATVQVQGEGATIRVDAEPDGATIRVDGEGEATVQVQSDSEATVQVQSDSEATVQVQGEGGATVRVDDDEEDAHAGLDLPTAMIQGFGGDPSKAAEEEEAAATPRDLKKIGIALGVVVLIPAILLGLLRFNANSTFDELQTNYATLVKAKDKRPDKLRSLAAELEKFAVETPFAGSMAEKARGLKNSLEGEASRIERDEKTRREEEERKKKAAAEAARIAGEREKVLTDYKRAEAGVLQIEDEARNKQQGGSMEAADLWQAYVEGAKKLLKDFAEKRLDHKEIDDRLGQIRFPVFVTSDPSGAEVLVKNVPQGRTPLVLRERPGQTVTVTIRRKGFTEATRTGTVKGALYLDCPLDRKTLRDPLELGQLAVRFGAGKIAEEILPRTSFEASSGDRLVFVGHGGYLRSYSPQSGRLVWTEEEQHAVARYGDPVADLAVIDGRAILAASPMGQLRAHSPGNGSLIWKVQLDAPATSTPVYKRVFKLLAVGTASGSVYLIDDAGEIKSTFQTENPVVSPPYFYGDKICVIGSTDNRLYAVDWRSGRVPKELSRLDLGSDVVVGPQPVGRKLVVGTGNGQVHVITVSQRGKLSLEVSLGEAGPDPVRGIVVDGDALYFTSGSKLSSYDANGKARWSEPFGVAARLTAPYATVEGGMIYVGDARGTLYAVGKAEGESRWRFPIPGEGNSIERPPVKVGEELLVCSGGKIYVLAAD